MAPRRKDTTAVDDKKDPPAGTDGEHQDDGASDGGGDDGGEITRGDLREMIRDEIKTVVDELKAGGGGDDGDKGKAKPPAGGDGDAPRSPAIVETDMRRLVSEEVSRIRKDDELVARLGKVEEAVKEKPPAPVRRLTSLMWR